MAKHNEMTAALYEECELGKSKEENKGREEGFQNKVFRCEMRMLEDLFRVLMSQ
jgi:hypothetical protein